MSFLENLTKGFIKSAVNQVGRDGGKVISNKVYGNNHSTPIRGVVQEGNYFVPLAPTSATVIREDLISAGYKVELLESGLFSYFFILIGSIIFPILGPIYWLYIAGKNFFKKNVRFYTIQQEPTYVRDRRFKTGRRQEGYRNVKLFSSTPIEPIRSEKKIFIFKGFVALMIAIAIGYFHYSIISATDNGTFNNLPVNQSKEIGIVTAKNGLRLRLEPSEKSSILLTIPVNDTVLILESTEKIDSIGNASWYKIEYKKQIGWGWRGLIEKSKK